MEELKNKTIQNVIECINLQSSKDKSEKIQKYKPIIKRMNNFFNYINGIPNFEIKCDLKIINGKFGKSYLLTNIEFPYEFKNMYMSVVKKIYEDEEIDIMEKIDKTFGDREDLCFFTKCNNKELIDKISNGECKIILQFGSISNDLDKDLKINFYIKEIQKIKKEIIRFLEDDSEED